ncbi:MAG: hypothetical protein GXY58_08270 [Planctomycetaceae bacterium]|nr:hypothetical protein [Planctomycetaceae bacterium]
MAENYSDLLTLQQASRDIFGGRVSYHSLRRWHVLGVGVPPIRLRAVRIGARYFVRRCDIDEFLAAQANPDLYKRRQKTERVEKAKRRLQRAGA